MAYYSKKLKMPFQEVLSKIAQNLQLQGFSVITEVDIKDTFQKKLNISFRNYKIMSVCNPHLSYKAISLESHMGVTLPCNIVIQEHENGEVEVSANNPLENLDKMYNTTQLVDLSTEMGIRLRAAVDYIQREQHKIIQDALPLTK